MNKNPNFKTNTTESLFASQREYLESSPLDDMLQIPTILFITDIGKFG